MFFDARLGGTCGFASVVCIRKAAGSTLVTSLPDAQPAPAHKSAASSGRPRTMTTRIVHPTHKRVDRGDCHCQEARAASSSPLPRAASHILWRGWLPRLPVSRRSELRPSRVLDEQAFELGKSNPRRPRSFTRSRVGPPLSFQPPASGLLSARPCPPWPSSGSPFLAQERRSRTPRTSSAPAIPARQRLPTMHRTPHYQRRTRTYETRWQG